MPADQSRVECRIIYITPHRHARKVKPTGRVQPKTDTQHTQTRKRLETAHRPTLVFSPAPSSTHSYTKKFNATSSISHLESRNSNPFKSYLILILTTNDEQSSHNSPPSRSFTLS